MNNKQILETLKLQPLSEEEKAKRHILGRLYGPIATCKEGTRNGRLYNKALWEKALQDDIFREKVANKSLFLELGHPLDREETDMRNVCACIPELPKIVNGDLYTYVDILDTANGRLLKTLCDYGFVPGISSRGSGDVLPNDEVDPETFFLETWDIVQLPAVKKARLTVCESLNQTKPSLCKALNESLNSANDEDLEVMKDALNNLNISIEEDLQSKKQLTADDIPWAPDEEEILLEADADEVEEESAELETSESSEEVMPEVSPAEIVEEPEDEDYTEEEPVPEVFTVGDLIKILSEFDESMEINISALDRDGEQIESNVFELDSNDNGLVMSVNFDYDQPEKGFDDNIDVVDKDDKDAEVSVEDEEVSKKDEIQPEDAEDNGTMEMLESLKEMIRLKDGFEAEVKTLQKDKAVCDAKVEALQEEVQRYKTSFERISAVASKIKPLKAAIRTLSESIQNKNIQISKLEKEVNSITKLNETLAAKDAKITQLTREVETLEAEKTTALQEQKLKVASINKKLAESIEQTKIYKSKFASIVNKYIESKAAMVGVNPSEIKNRLNESFTLTDIDKVCDSLLDYNISMNKLPFNTRNTTAKPKVVINEAIPTKKVNTLQQGYEIDDSLLELAGLKD